MGHKRRKKNIRVEQFIATQVRNGSKQTSTAEDLNENHIDSPWWHKPQWALAIITFIGIVVHLTGLKNPFQGDDQYQIVNNSYVHSITNIGHFFTGSTFSGGDTSTLVGSYYRPMMTTIFSVIYTLFGLHSFYYHIIQLLLGVGAAILLYLIFNSYFGTVLSLVLALVFMVHPENSQVLFAIPSMQDALFLFFGLLSLLILMKFNSTKGLVLADACLFLSLLSKETGLLFVLMDLFYLYWFKREKVRAFAIATVPVIVLYIALRANAVGLFDSHVDLGPIDSASIGDRLLTAPSIMLFYMSKFFFPWKLASQYYWVEKSFNFQHVLLPLVFDAIVVAVCVYVGRLVRRLSQEHLFYVYLLFAIWAALGILVLLQLFPLDMTASETWFYFPMVGVLGMVGVVLVSFQAHIKPQWFYVVAAVLITALGVRTFFRGLDWSNQYKLAVSDIVASRQDWTAYNTLSLQAIDQGDNAKAYNFASKAYSIYPSVQDSTNLGLALTNLGKYPEAETAYINGLKYPGDKSVLYDNIGALAFLYGDYNTNKRLISNGLTQEPNNSQLWTQLAVIEYRAGDAADARVALQTAQRYGTVPGFVYNGIESGEQFTITYAGKTVKI